MGDGQNPRSYCIRPKGSSSLVKTSRSIARPSLGKSKEKDVLVYNQILARILMAIPIHLTEAEPFQDSFALR